MSSAIVRTERTKLQHPLTPRGNMKFAVKEKEWNRGRTFKKLSVA